MGSIGIDPVCTYEVKLLGVGDAALLLAADPQIFDRALDPRWTDTFLRDPRHHIAVAIFGGLVVGSATATQCLQPDQPSTLFIAEVAVAREHRRQGAAKAMLQALLAHGRALGCAKARVGTEADNAAARSLYASVGATVDSDAFVTYTFDLT
ncbi:MAG: GNAT family N-acetyltransferase [Pseudomonadota bacterium]